MARILFVFVAFSFSQPQLLDGVVAVVGNRVVLFSEVKEESDMVARERSVPLGSFAYEKIFRGVLDKNINNKVILNFAKEDSLLEVPYQEIKSLLDERVGYYVQQFGSEGEFEKAVGLSVLEMKEKHWKTIEEELLVEKYKLKNFKDVVVTKHDVLAFYNEYKDSLPPSPAIGSFSVFQKKIKPSKKNLLSFLNKTSLLRDSLALGLLDFTEVALKRSIDPSVKKNKGIMESLRGDLVPEYEKTAYLLAVDEVSSVVESRFGFHIIKLLNKKGEKIKTQHILLSLPVLEGDAAASYSFLDSLQKSTLNDPGLFDSLTVAVGDGLSGVYSDVPIDDFPFFVGDFLKKGENFSFSNVIKKDGFFNVVLKYSFSPSEPKNIENSWFELEALTINKKRFELFDLWISEKKENMYIFIKEF